MTMRKLSVLLLVFLCGAAQAGAQTAHSHPDSVRIITSDVESFWRAFDTIAAGAVRDDSVKAMAVYFQAGTPGLAAYFDSKVKKPEAMLFGLALLPKYYAAVRSNTLRIRDREPVIRAALRRLEAIYPETRYPDIYLMIGGFIAQGTVAGGNMLLSAEMVSADSTTPMHELPPFLRDVNLTTTVLPCILVHELVHFQQDYPQDRSLLAQVMTEGVADFVTQQAIGCIPTAAATYAWGEEHERELWAQFQQDMAGNDHSRWLYNGNIKDRPGQLGYWMGYQIAEAYYNRADDKSQAMRDLLNIRDYQQLLERSGYGKQFVVSGISVELDMYSGRPNPVWQLSEEESAQLLAHLSDLPEATAVTPDHLGYRGFLVRYPSGQQFRVYSGSIFLEDKVYADLHDAEAWLVAYAERKGVRLHRAR
jgi:hypothetical protein